MARIRAELRLQNDESSLSTLSESVGPVAPLTLSLLDFVLTGSTPPDGSAFTDLTEKVEVTPGSQDDQRTPEGRRENYEWLSEAAQSVTEVYAEDGALHVTLTVEDRDQLRDLVADVEGRCGAVSVECLTEVSEPDASTPGRNGDRRRQPTLPDRGQRTLTLPTESRRQLTDRQYEVLAVAHDLGYFEYPRGANAEDVAEELGITQSTFAEHLSAAQSKLVGELLEVSERSRNVESSR
jgi:predicted DNA binding protein